MTQTSSHAMAGSTADALSTPPLYDVCGISRHPPSRNLALRTKPLRPWSSAIPLGKGTGVFLASVSPEAAISYLTARVRARGGPESPATAQLEKELEFEYAFVKAGGLLVFGCDPTGNGGATAGFGDQRNLELLGEGGFTPVQAIQIATENGAKLLGELDKRGTIAAGKSADLVIIDGNPARAWRYSQGQSCFQGRCRLRSRQADRLRQGCNGNAPATPFGRIHSLQFGRFVPFSLGIPLTS